MESLHESVTVRTYGDKTFLLLGTAHVSQESVADVRSAISDLAPEVVCIELDQGRYQAMTQDDSWNRLDIFKVIKEGRGFLLLSNLLLSSYQKRLGLDLGVKPGAEMGAALDAAAELGLPFRLIDRDISTTLKRAWAKSSLWGKSKLLAALLGSAFGGETIDKDQIENLKKTSELHGMLEELSSYLPAVKTVLIDERDQFMAARLCACGESRVLAVLGAGHIPGIVKHLDAHFGTQEQSGNPPGSPSGNLPGSPLDPAKNLLDTGNLELIPPPAWWSKALGWVIPLGIVAFLVLGFVKGGMTQGFGNILTWVIFNGGGAALGSLLALAHPLTILVGLVGAPLATLNPFLGIGMFTGLTEAWLRKPRVQDLENLQTDITSFGGFFRNRVTRVLLVFVLSSIGAIIGNLLTFPLIAPWG